MNILEKNKKIIKLEHASAKMNNYVRIEWNMSKRCNYNCSYCSDEIHDNYSPHMPFKDVEKMLTTLISFKKENEEFHLNLSGGEPFVHPNIVDISKLIYDLGFNWKSVNTNGSVSIKKYIDTLKYINHYVFSWHLEHARKDHMENLLLEMKKANAKFRCMLMFLPGHLNEIKKIKDFLDENQIPVIVRRIHPMKKNGKLVRPRLPPKDSFTRDENEYYSKEELEWLDKIDQEQISVLRNVKITFEDGETLFANDTVIRNQKLNNFYGWKCMAGVKRLVIYQDGSIYKGVCKQDGLIGNIFSNNFSMPTEPTVCTKKICVCVGEIAMLKWVE